MRDLEEQLKVAELREAEMAQTMAKDQADRSEAMDSMKQDFDMTINELQVRGRLKVRVRVTVTVTVTVSIVWLGVNGSLNIMVAIAHQHRMR